MFLFESINWTQGLMWLVVLGALIGLNELVRWSKAAAYALFIILPIILTIFVWPYTASAGSSTGTWPRCWSSTTSAVRSARSSPRRWVAARCSRRVSGNAPPAPKRRRLAIPPERQLAPCHTARSCQNPVQWRITMSALAQTHDRRYTI